MNSYGNLGRTGRLSERGGARLNFLIAVILVASVGYIGYQYIPVDYDARLYKDAMQNAVDKAAVTTWAPEKLKDQLRLEGKELGVPPEAAISVDRINGRIQARVSYKRPIAFPGYTYDYNFDHTVQSSQFFAGQ